MLSFLEEYALDIQYDLESNKLLYGKNLKYEYLQKVDLNAINPTLLNRSLTYPESVYEEYIGVSKISDSCFTNSDISYDIINLPPGLLGIEFIKTHIFYSEAGSQKDKISSTIEVLLGEVLILMQKNREYDGVMSKCMVSNAYIVKVKKGEKCSIPEGFFYTFINTTPEAAIFSRAYREYKLADYNEIRKTKGLAYFCIRKNGKLEIVLNPQYKQSPKLKYIDCKNKLVCKNIDEHKTLYQYVVEKLNNMLT